MPHDYVLITDADNRISLPHLCLIAINDGTAKASFEVPDVGRAIALFSTRYPR